ncbi:uncharacterized protein LODBEIA_P54380 [Lodderomyces beijingensis]|uniref:Uncharacterized protein n=1 Tax=Lodderomyces beijingensis TaxID=1775926 RepID=A0ABP0ZSV2_9ASCO
MSYLSTGLKGLIAGALVTPVVTKCVIVPIYYNPAKDAMKEIHYIQQEMEYVGWNVRHIQEDRGYAEEDMYTPGTYYKQGQS